MEQQHLIDLIADKVRESLELPAGMSPSAIREASDFVNSPAYQAHAADKPVIELLGEINGDFIKFIAELNTKSCFNEYAISLLKDLAGRYARARVGKS
jgi:hypothetical protein